MMRSGAARMIHFFCLILMMAGAPAGAGTSVGNFNFKTQIEFDFRFGFPKDWQWERQTPSANEVDRWSVSNFAKAGSEKSSTAYFTFLSPFPASTDLELRREITRLHPSLVWKEISNPDFSIGYVSNQVFIGSGRTRSFEYYFSDEKKVVRIEVIRDQTVNGASEIDTILTTIRRPSGMPKILSIKSEANRKYKVGSQACYLIEVDLLKNNFDDETLNRIDVKGAHAHWSFKTVTWIKKETSFRVCVPVTERFAKDGLVITSLSLSPSGAPSLTCNDSSREAKQRLTCLGNPKYDINYAAPEVDNPAPIRRAPEIKSMSLGKRKTSVRLIIDSPIELASGELILDSTAEGARRGSVVLYEDELRGRDFEIAVDPKRLNSGFTRVLEVVLTDKVGNATMLKAKPSETHYSLYRTDSSPVRTDIPVLSLVRGEK